MRTSARPEYPAQLLDVLRPAGRVLDLAAGTGKLTRLLRASPAHVVAIEPLAELRAYLDADEVPRRPGRGAPAARRVGRPRHRGRRVALVRPRGARPRSSPRSRGPADGSRWCGRRRTRRGRPPGPRRSGRGALDAHPAFDGLTEHRVPFVGRPSPDRYVDDVGSTSFVAGLAHEDRRDLLGRVAAVVPEGPLAVPFATRCWLTSRGGLARPQRRV